MPSNGIYGQFALSDVRDAAKQRADMVASGFVTDAEWLSYINGSYTRLWGLLSEKFGEDYNAATNDQTTDGTDSLMLPPDFFKLLGVDLQWSGSPTGWVSLKQFTFSERNRISPIAWQNPMATRPRYRLKGFLLWLLPQPPAGLNLRMHYVQRCPALVEDTDLMDGVNGWEEYVVVDAARKALLKEESDTSGLERELVDLVTRIEHEASNRNPGEAPTVADVQRGGQDLPDGWWQV